jgi:hypothetical protein
VNGPGESGPYTFGHGQHTWYDIDPFDNDPDRNDDDESAPEPGLRAAR